MKTHGAEPARRSLREVSEDGLRAVVLKLVTLKFGPPSDAARHRIDEASVEELEAWAERILTVTGIEELLLSDFTVILFTSSGP